jgi:hypothetical protein
MSFTTRALPALRRQHVLPSALRPLSNARGLASFAKMTLIGRLGESPEMHPTSTGHEVLRYNVATSSGPRDSPRTSWFRVTSFVPEGPQRDFVLGLEKGYVIPLFFSLLQERGFWGGVQNAFVSKQQKLTYLRSPNPNANANQKIYYILIHFPPS